MRHLKRVGIALLAAVLLFAQTGGLNIISGTIDFSGATITKPNAAGAALPGTCSVGSTFFRTSDNTEWFCSAVNTFSQFGGVGTLHSIGFVIDGGGAVIATGDAKVYPTADFACTINRIDISADQSGSITVDVWKVAGAIPVAGNKISAAAPLTLVAAQLAQNGSRTGWTTAVAVGDVFGFSVATVATVTRVVGQIWCQ